MKNFFTLLLFLSQICSAQTIQSKITSFTLVNSVTGAAIRALTNGSTIDLGSDGNKLNIRANTYGTLTSVGFVLTGSEAHFNDDERAPFCLLGDDNGSYNDWTPTVGSYTLKATPILLGTAGSTETITFSVKNSSGSTNQNLAPTVNAGSDASVTLPTNSITLNGICNDPDGLIVKYQWTKIDGPAQFSIASPAQAKTNVNNLIHGVYTFQLRVTDNTGATAADLVKVTVNQAPPPPVPNQVPSANAGTDLSITLPTNSATLSGSASDPDGIIAAYNWTKFSGPAQFTIASPTQLRTNISNLVQGVYSFKLMVTDNKGSTATDIVTVTVLPAPLPTNKVPTVNAGNNISITLPTNRVTLTGVCNDPDGRIVKYQWTKLAGPSRYSIASPAQAKTNVNDLVEGAYTFELRVTDDRGAVASARVNVTVKATPPSPVTNQVPAASAGPDITITLPTNRATLTGSGSDPDGTIAAYRWTKISGPSRYTILSPNQKNTNISNLVQGVYRFVLRVTDNKGSSSNDTVNVTVNPAPLPPNKSPTVNAGKDITITLPVNSATLTGVCSDPDGTITKYQWTKLIGPSQFTIASASQAKTNVNNLVEGVYDFELQATDNRGAIAKDIVSVTVKGPISSPIQSPTANAGSDITITLPTNSISLSGSGNDPGGSIAAYQWTKLTGPSQFTIVTASQAQTTVNNLVQGVYTFELKVTDNLGATGTDIVRVTVNAAPTPANQAPTANAGSDVTITLPTNSVSLSGSGNDPGGSIAAYQWTKLTGPSQFTIVTASQAQTTVNNLVQGVYTFELKVTDNLGATGTDIVKVTVNAAPTPANQAPTANAGSDITITLPTNSVSLNGSGNDPGGSISAYQWTKLTGPSQFTIVTASQAQTTVNNLVQGVYTFELKVTDNLGATGTDIVTITVNAVPQQPTNKGGYYASPNGGGNGTFTAPFRIADFWKVAKAGDTLNLMDGHYIGASSMINPPENLSGTAANRIVIRALNDGKADIDGQGQNAPVSLNYNNYFTLEGFNAHNAGNLTSINVTVVNINYSSYNILRRICAWEAADGNTNVFGVHHGDYNLLEDCAGWGTARKTFSNSQQGNYTTFRRCFGRWEGSHAEGPKKTFGVSYNSYNALLENCIGTWDGLKMKQTYELHDYSGVGVGKNFSNYEVQQPDGIFSHDGFDVLPDVANARLYGCIAYIKANQRYHNSFKKWAAPFAFEIKGIDIRNSLSFIQPGSYADIWNVNLSSVGNTTTNNVDGLTQIGGELGHISSDWTPSNMVASATCNGMNTGTVITKRYVDGVLTNQDLWPWPMNQRIIDAMLQGGYTPVDVTKEIFGLCGSTPPSTSPSVDIVAVAKKWLASTSGRDTLEAVLDAWKGNIDSVIQKVRPTPTSTQTGEIFYQNFTNPVFQQKYPNHQFHMYVPTHYNPSTPIGVMLWLHGGASWDASEIDHLAIYDMDNEKVTGRSYPRTETDNSNYILVAPIAPFGSVLPHPQHWSRWDVPAADQYLIDIITELSTRYNIDYNRIVLAGFSMGGIGAYHQALRLNDRLAAVMASAGCWDLGTWDGLKNMPMYIISGVNDAYFNGNGDCRNHKTAIEYARLAHDALYKASTIHRLYEYPGGHPWDASGQLYWKNFLSGQTGWVTDKVRNPYRTNVTAVNPWRSYDVGSSYTVTWTEDPSPHTMWITIKQTGTGTIPYNWARQEGTGGCSSQADFNSWSLTADTKNLPGGKAEANITGPNQIVVTSTNVTKMSLWLHPKMVNFSNPVQVTLNGVTKSYTLKSSLLTALKSYERRWDWGMIYHAELDIN